MKLITIAEHNIPRDNTAAGIAAAAKRGNVVHLAPGDYFLEDPVDLPNYVSAIALVPGQTWLHWAQRMIPGEPGTQQTLLTARGAKVSGINFKCGFNGNTAQGGVIAYWGQSSVEGCTVDFPRNGERKEGFGIFCDGAVRDCRVQIGHGNISFNTEITGICAGSIRDCEVHGLAESQSTTHGLTLLKPSRAICASSTVTNVTVGFYVDSHVLDQPIIADNLIMDCDIGIQLSGGVTADGLPRLNGRTRDAAIFRNAIRGARKTGIYIYAPIAYSDAEKKRPHCWHDGANMISNMIRSHGSGIMLQAAHFGYLGAVNASHNIIKAGNGAMRIQNEHVWKGGMIGGGANLGEFGEAVGWETWTGTQYVWA